MKFVKVARLIVGFLLIFSIGNSFSASGDVHGRDLSFIAPLGHIGIESKFGDIFEMSGSDTNVTSPYGHESDLQRLSVQQFGQGGYWGARYWKWLTKKENRWRTDDYIEPWAYITYYVGADYTTRSRGHHNAYARKDARGNYVNEKGKFRCDTYVDTMYSNGAVNFPGSLMTPRKIFYALPDQR